MPKSASGSCETAYYGRKLNDTITGNGRTRLGKVKQRTSMSRKYLPNQISAHAGSTSSRNLCLYATKCHGVNKKIVSFFSFEKRSIVSSHNCLRIFATVPLGSLHFFPVRGYVSNSSCFLSPFFGARAHPKTPTDFNF